MALIRVVSYYHRCDACGKDIPSTGNEPETGVVGKIEFPDSAHGQRSVYSYYSCKEQGPHVIKAIRVIIAKREEDVRSRKARGEKYSADKS